MDLKSAGMELASEMILKGARRGLKMAEVPIPYHPRIAESKLNTFRDGWRHLRFLILASPSYLYTVPGVVLILVGILTLGLALPSSHGIDVGPLRWQPIFGGTIFLVVGMNAACWGWLRAFTLPPAEIHEKTGCSICTVGTWDWKVCSFSACS